MPIKKTIPSPYIENKYLKYPYGRNWHILLNGCQILFVGITIITIRTFLYKTELCPVLLILGFTAINARLN